jgi:hypothetical protein
MLRFAIGDSAIILIDHQVGTSSWVGSIDVQELKENASILARFAGATGMPMVLTSSLEENVQAPLFPELKEVVPDAYEAWVRRLGIVNAWDDEAFAGVCRASGREAVDDGWPGDHDLGRGVRRIIHTQAAIRAVLKVEAMSDRASPTTPAACRWAS